MSTNNKWGALSMQDRAFLIREAVRNGITDIDSIRDTWEHRFDGESDQSVRIPSIIVTPDKQYNEYVNTLPDNQRNTPESEYRTHRAWELFGKPENFKQAVELGLYNWDNSDKSYHGNSVAYDRENDTYEFLKPKHHETVKYELDWYNKGLETLEGGEQRPLTGKDREFWQDFKSKYKLDESGSGYKYIPRQHTFDGESSQPTDYKKVIGTDWTKHYKKYHKIGTNAPAVPKFKPNDTKLHPIDKDISEGAGYLYGPQFYAVSTVVRDKTNNKLYFQHASSNIAEIPEGFEVLSREQVRKLLPKRDYIGGTKEQVRDKVVQLIPGLTDSIQAISSRHDISPQLLHHRVGKEGYYDSRAQEYNYDLRKGEMPNYWQTVAGREVNGFTELGLDDAGELLEKDLIKVTRPISYETINATNEKGRNVTSVVTPNLWDALEIKAGDIKYRQEEMRKRGYKGKDLDTWTNAAYNLGISHKDLENEEWIRKNYTLPDYSHLFKK